MATTLDKELKRRIAVDGVDYTVVLDPEGLRVVGKGKRKADVQLRWADLLSGDAAMAVALNASLGAQRTEAKATEAMKVVAPESAPRQAVKRAVRRG